MVAKEGNNSGKVTNIFCQEWGIGICVVHNALMTSDGWLELLLKMLLYMGGRVNISGFRGIEVGTKANSLCIFFGAVLVWRGRIVLLMRNI